MILHHYPPGYKDTAYERAVGAPSHPGPRLAQAPALGPRPLPRGGPQPGPTPNPRPGPATASGQAIVGQPITSAWWPGSFEVTQGWGETNLEREPAGHGKLHWHSGVDVGVPCGTTISLPSGTAQATVTAVDNPQGYGTALVVHLAGFDVWLGHLRQRLVANGATVRAGQELAVSNNTGNSSGCHVHFEVRKTGGKTASDNGTYGSDVDPTELLTAGVSAQVQNPLDALGSAISGELATAEQQISRILLGGGAVVLGSSMTLGGLLLVAYTARGGRVRQLVQRAGGAAGGSRGRGAGRRAPTGPRAAPEPPQGPQPAPEGPDIISSEEGRLGRRPRVMTAMEARRQAASSRARASSGRARGGGEAASVRQQAAALRREMAAARSARAAAGPDSKAWVEATVRLRAAEGRLAKLRPATAGAARVHR